MEMDDSLAGWLQSLCNGRTERSGISVWFYILRRFCSPIAAVCRRIVRIALGLLGLWSGLDRPVSGSSRPFAYGVPPLSGHIRVEYRICGLP